MANTCVFMFTGFLAATLFDTNAALGVVSNVSAIANPAYPAFAAARGWIAFAGVAVRANEDIAAGAARSAHCFLCRTRPNGRPTHPIALRPAP